MAQKQVFIDGVGEITLARRRGTRSLRLSVNANGRVRVGLPHWIPYKVAIRFAEQRKGWIIKHQSLNQHPLLAHGMKVGKAHSLHFSQDPRLKTVRSRIDQAGVYINGPYGEKNARTQAKARQGCERALAQEAASLLPPLLDKLARQQGYRYKDLQIKKLTSRWGSCSSAGVITLSYFMMQLPWQLIDYVIVHELAHTKYLNHGPRFWQAMEKFAPDAKKLQKKIRSHKPRVEPWQDLIQTPPFASIDRDGLL